MFCFHVLFHMFSPWKAGDSNSSCTALDEASKSTVVLFDAAFGAIWVAEAELETSTGSDLKHSTLQTGGAIHFP